jgi:hypothetical protein
MRMLLRLLLILIVVTVIIFYWHTENFANPPSGPINLSLANLACNNPGVKESTPLKDISTECLSFLVLTIGGCTIDSTVYNNLPQYKEDNANQTFEDFLNGLMIMSAEVKVNPESAKLCKGLQYAGDKA